MRIVITGAPGAGKTTLAETLAKVLGCPIYHTDDTKDMEWSAASEAVSYWFARPDPWIIEGVTVPRAFRKWIARHIDGPVEEIDPAWIPFDRIVVMRNPLKPLELQGQQTMQKTVLGLIDNYKGILTSKWVEL